MKPKLDCPLCSVFMVQKRISVNTPPFYRCPICGSTFFPGVAAATERQQQAARDGLRARTPKPKRIKLRPVKTPGSNVWLQM